MRLRWYRLLRASMFLAMTFGGLMSGCTPSSGVRHVDTPFKLDASSSKIAVKLESLRFEMEPALLNELLGATIAALRETRKFSRVSALEHSIDAAPDLILEIELTSAREVSNALRGFFGIFAGTGSLVADVRVVNASTKAVIGKATIAAKTSGGSSFAGTNSEAVDQFAEQVVEFMLGR